MSAVTTDGLPSVQVAGTTNVELRDQQSSAVALEADDRALQTLAAVPGDRAMAATLERGGVPQISPECRWICALCEQTGNSYFCQACIECLHAPAFSYSQRPEQKPDFEPRCQGAYEECMDDGGSNCQCPREAELCAGRPPAPC